MVNYFAGVGPSGHFLTYKLVGQMPHQPYVNAPPVTKNLENWWGKGAPPQDVASPLLANQRPTWMF